MVCINLHCSEYSFNWSCRYDWILVGAPLKPSSYDSPEVGAVYVYKNTGGAVVSYWK